MNKIYHMAQCTLVYFGEADEYSNLAMETIFAMAEDIFRGENSIFSDNSKANMSRFPQADYLNEEATIALAMLFARK